MRTHLVPGQTAPEFRFPTLGHGEYDLAADVPAGGTFVVFHRGLHCKWGRRSLKELDDRIGDFAIRALRVVAVSGDGPRETARLQEQMQLIRLPLGHSVDVREAAEAWGVYLTANSPAEGAPPLHFEPAQFWVKCDGTVGICTYQSAPSLWPDASATLRAIDMSLKEATGTA